MKPLSSAPTPPARAGAAVLAALALLPGLSPAAPAPAAEESPRFDIWEYRVFGNTVMDPGQVQKTVYPYLGPGRSIDDVEKARQGLEEAYHKAGYETVLVNVPEQDVENGLVKLEVTEGKVERLRISGSRYYSLGHIREKVPALAEGKVPHMPSLQNQLTELGAEAADRQVTPVLRSGSVPGAFEAELKVKDELPVHGSLEMNGRNSVGTSYSRLIASLRYDNLWQLNHSASLSYQVAPQEKDVEVWSGTYAMPLYGMRLAFYGVGVSSSSAMFTAGAFGVLGTGNIYGLRLVKPLDPWPNYFHSLTFGVDYKDFDQAVRLSSGRTSDPVSYVPFVIGYGGGFRRGDGLTSFNLETHFAFRGVGDDPAQFANRRYRSQTNFVYFAGSVKHEHRLPGDFGLGVRVSGQVSDSPLISNEQMSAGGAYSVRGYYETQLLGDDGVVGSLELQSLRLAPDDWDFAQNLRALAFVEGAKLWSQYPAPGTPASSSLASAGLGMRMALLGHMVGELDWAYPFIRAGTVGPGDQRIHFRLAYEF